MTAPREFEWDTTDRFTSNYGRGPLTARIARVADEVATLIRTTRRGGPMTYKFNLPLGYFASARCGWRKAKP